MSRTRFQTLAALVFAGAAASVPGEPSVQSALADHTYCTVCHGTDFKGDSAIQAPALAAVEPWYLTEQLKAYRAGQRGTDPKGDPQGAEMRTVARELTDAQIADIVGYVGKFRVAPRVFSVQGDVAKGRSEYATSCAACHGPQGAGNQALHAPDLVRLNDWYVVDAYDKYRAGQRGASATNATAYQMHQIATAVPAGFSINDVAAYLNTLPVETKK